MATGICKWFNDSKGFGFITPDGAKKDIFVHYSGIKKLAGERRNLKEGAKVSFDIMQGEKGDQAQNVTEI